MMLSYYLSVPINSTKVIYVPKGSIKKIITYLIDKKFELTPLDVYFLRFLGSPQSGWIDIGITKLSRGDFLYKLTKAKAPVIEVTLIPGETTEIFLKEAADRLKLNFKKLNRLYLEISPFPDGVLIPDTYHIPIGIDEKHFIYYMVSTSLKRHKKISEKFFGKYDKERWFKKYITIASIIQKEAANEQEMPLISAVIYNRLKLGMPLQMDGALNYGKYSHVKITKKRIRNDNSPFNTYKFKGLPPFPVCCVSKEAIKAAIFPAKVNYLYFVKGKNGNHIFTSSYKRHLTNIKAVKK
ncbi:endolytic transglycosylase MltG [Nitrosophilus labii]|uniref:endolytic transglycosylase MltG n=1 Tax=Nitrosophilus labii TaxID=2706014 RepID=UPI001FEACFA3|nr:endolytic transglycosylase MltG [Nitrosophilus labii]